MCHYFRTTFYLQIVEIIFRKYIVFFHIPRQAMGFIASQALWKEKVKAKQFYRENL